MQSDNIVGLTEIAERLGVEVNTANVWRKRARTLTKATPFPAPDGWIGGRTPWWYWNETIVPWAQATGRLS